MQIKAVLQELFFSQTSIAFGLGLLVGISIVFLPKFISRVILRYRVEEVYFKLRLVCEPEILNPDHPGNMAYMKAEARDAANGLIKLLRKAGFEPPNRCDSNDQSLYNWFQFLEVIRIEVAGFLPVKRKKDT